MTASPTTTFALHVAGVRRLSPTFTRVTLGGDELARFHPCGPLGPRDLRVKLIFPEPGGAVRTRPGTGAGWFPRWRALDPAERGYLRTYTIRHARLAGAEPQLDIDVVLHVDGAPGLGSAWAAGAHVGDTVLLMGPVRGDDMPDGIEWRPPAPDAAAPPRVLLVGDETAVPAVASILRTLPAGYVGDAVLEVPDARDVQSLPTASGVRVAWLPRAGVGAPHGSILISRVRDLVVPRGAACGRARPQALPAVDIDRERLWEVGGDTEPLLDGRHTTATDVRYRYAWVAGEAATVRALRAHLVHACGMDRRRIAFMGYWRRGRAEPN